MVGALIAAAFAVGTAAQAPSTSTVVHPAPNEAGWHSAPVTVSFSCVDGSRDCRPDVVFDRDGVGQRLDLPASAQAKAERIVINLDRTAPTVTLDTPSDGLRTTAAHLDVSGRASDGLSGLHWAACNGVRVAVGAGRVRCRVPLEVGTNAVIVHAMDNAGNSASAAIRVIRLDPMGPLSVVPSRMTRGLRSSHGGAFQAVSPAGPVADDVRWSSDSSDLATVTAYGGSVQVTPQTPGTLTLRARLREASATAAIQVLDAEDMPSGVEVWAVAPPPGSSTTAC